MTSRVNAMHPRSTAQPPASHLSSPTHLASHELALSTSRMPWKTSAQQEEPSIRPLPEHVIAQLKSSTVIVSLTGVVLELLKNALDARASKLEATVDFVRGGCSVEDNGLGVAPLEFREDGGLAKLYCPSLSSSQTLYF